MFGGPLLRIDNRLSDSTRGGGIVTYQRAAQAQHAAGEVGVFAFQVVIDFHQVVLLLQQPALWIVGSQRLHFAFAQRFAKQVGRILQPVDLLIGIDALFRQLNGEEVANRAGLIADRHRFAHQIFHIADAAILRRE